MTATTIEVPNGKVAFITKLISELGLNYSKAEKPENSTTAADTLYEPETGQMAEAL